MIKCIITDLKVSKDAEVKASQSTGKTFTSVLCYAYAGKDKEQKAKYVNVRVTFFGKTAERAGELRKGNVINVVANVTDLSHYVRQDGGITKTLELVADTYEKPLGERSHDNAQQAQRQQPTADSFTEGAYQSEDLPF